MNIFEEYLGFILGIVGAAIALAASVTEKVSRQPKARMVVLLAVLGFIVFSAQQLIQASLDANNATLINKIKNTVIRTNEVVNDIADRLANVSMIDIGKRLITIRDDPTIQNAEKIESMEKGSPSDWLAYSQWIERVNEDDEVKACLSLTLDYRHTYMAGLIQGYLLTDNPDSEVNNAIKDALFSGSDEQWKRFPDSDFVEQFGIKPPFIQCVLIYDKKILIAYGDASAFANELYFLQRQNKYEDLDRILNRMDDPQGPLREMFPSLNVPIRHDGDVPAIARSMLDNKYIEMVIVQDANYFVKLLDLIAVAKESR